MRSKNLIINGRWYKNKNITKYRRKCFLVFSKIDLLVSKNFGYERKSQHLKNAEKTKKAEKNEKSRRDGSSGIYVCACCTAHDLYSN